MFYIQYSCYRKLSTTITIMCGSFARCQVLCCILAPYASPVVSIERQLGHDKYLKHVLIARRRLITNLYTRRERVGVFSFELSL
jgi:hypothetical protein